MVKSKRSGPPHPARRKDLPPYPDPNAVPLEKVEGTAGQDLPAPTPDADGAAVPEPSPDASNLDPPPAGPAGQESSPDASSLDPPPAGPAGVEYITIRVPVARVEPDQYLPQHVDGRLVEPSQGRGLRAVKNALDRLWPPGPGMQSHSYVSAVRYLLTAINDAFQTNNQEAQRGQQNQDDPQTTE